MIIITTILQLPVQRALTLVHRLILSSSSALALKHVETTGSMEKSHQPKAFRESTSSTSVVSSLADPSLAPWPGRQPAASEFERRSDLKSPRCV